MKILATAGETISERLARIAAACKLEPRLAFCFASINEYRFSFAAMSDSDFERTMSEIFQRKERLEEEKRREAKKSQSEIYAFRVEFLEFARKFIVPRFEKAKGLLLEKNYSAESKLSSGGGEPNVTLSFDLRPIGDSRNAHESGVLRFCAASERRGVKVERTVGKKPGEELHDFSSMSPELVEREIILAMNAIAEV